ncbi:MAG: single-stranded-DNA-specific exonuclease RecJ [Prevotellaceae bacterium]|jgi:single-stranded-DNA-specific exonuclease|nr:single-stranded-DNA-specific exonuclease RecJ [Prevotellaceae bacterium]
MEKIWKVKESGNPVSVRHLAAELDIDQTLANLLVQRGVTTFAEAKMFFRPQLAHLHDPFLMKDMDKAVARIRRAIQTNERIMIYGDYDVDGTTAVSMVYSFLKRFSPHVSFYIPDRYNEGYGISFQGIDYAKQSAISLIIALDCGIKANDRIDYARERGIDFIICDHHLPGDDIPQALAVLDPKRADCGYPFNELSGCGVGFKLLQAFCVEEHAPFEQLIPFLDLVAVSIASDVVPMIGENRVLAYYGLKQLNENPSRGLQSIIRLSGLDRHRHPISTDDILFKIGPRINAAGRMESGKTAVDLLTADNEEIAVQMGNAINMYNDDRRNVDREITQEAIAMVDRQGMMESKKAVVLFNPSWHKGVVGIVASRLVEAFYRPAIVLTESNGMITGSARSIPGFDLYEAVESCADLLETFGGHMYATGLSLRKEHLDTFRIRFEKQVAATISDELLTPQIDVDTYLDFKQITPKFFRILKQFQPFGPGNMSPVFITENVYDNGNGRRVGNGDHLKLALIQEEEPYRPISAIAFNYSEHFDYMRAGNPIDICYSIFENYYRGIANIQLNVRGIKERGEIV